MMRAGMKIARGLCRVSLAISSNSIRPIPPGGILQHQRASYASVRTMAPRDFSQPNSSWGSEMRRLYEHYNSQCEEETEEGEKRRGPWRRVPSYNRSLKYTTGGVYLSKIIQSKARLFTRNIKEQGAAFEYVIFVSKAEQRHVHGGAIATMIDTVTGTHAAFLSGPVMTANLNINYRSPIPLGSTVLLTCSLDKKDGRKTFLSCQVTSTDGSKLHTEATGLFLSISVSHLLGV